MSGVTIGFVKLSGRQAGLDFLFAGSAFLMLICWIEHTASMAASWLTILRFENAFGFRKSEGRSLVLVGLRINFLKNKLKFF